MILDFQFDLRLSDKLVMESAYTERKDAGAIFIFKELKNGVKSGKTPIYTSLGLEIKKIHATRHGRWQSVKMLGRNREIVSQADR